jgi:hypothetical protein
MYVSSTETEVADIAVDVHPSNQMMGNQGF